ncbi:EboA domain-containing protein [Streptomyces sp. NPDC001774]
MTTPDRLRAALRETPGAALLDAALVAAAERPESVRRSFPAAARHTGREALPGVPGWSADEAARALLLVALPPDRAAATCELYRHGDTDEKRAVLKALPMLDIGTAAQPLLHDAIRTNDARLVAAALGPCAHDLDQDTWRQAVLKCVFMGVPLAVMDGLEERADDELGAMLAAFADERGAAGRSTPADAAALSRRLIHKEP